MVVLPLTRRTEEEEYQRRHKERILIKMLNPNLNTQLVKKYRPFWSNGEERRKVMSQRGIKKKGFAEKRRWRVRSMDITVRKKGGETERRKTESLEKVLWEVKVGDRLIVKSMRMKRKRVMLWTSQTMGR